MASSLAGSIVEPSGGIAIASLDLRITPPAGKKPSPIPDSSARLAYVRPPVAPLSGFIIAEVSIIETKNKKPGI